MFSFPFTPESIQSEFQGICFSLCRRILPKGMVEFIDDFILEDADKYVKVENGILYLLDERGRQRFCFNGLTTENGSVFLSGEDFLGIKRDSHLQAILYPEKILGDDYTIIVSSHVDYEALTIPRLVRSLCRNGKTIEELKNSLFVVVGGADKYSMTEAEGYKRIAIKENMMGMTGLIPLLKGYLEVFNKYVFLLHDTCEVTQGFSDMIRLTDVGLNYDFIGVASDLREVGLWSTDFITKIKNLSGFDFSRLGEYNLFDRLLPHASLYTIMGGVEQGREKDVYGIGTLRRVVEARGLPLKKYLGCKQIGGSP